MKKALLNYWVDVVTGIALFVCAVTGIVRLFPAATSVASGTATIFGVSSALWASVHDWSGVMMAAGVALHTVLHARWLVHMTRRIARGETPGGSRARPRSDAGSRRRTPAAAPAGSPDAGAATSLSRLEALGAGRADEPRRMNRKAFLLGAAAVGGVAVLAGVGLAAAGGDGGTAIADSGTTAATSATGTSASAHAASGSSSSQASSSASSGSSASSTASGSASGSETVVVDAGSCVGCGHCVESCPHGVFSFNGGKAVVTNVSACTLCGRCIQVCRPQAITLNG